MHDRAIVLVVAYKSTATVECLKNFLDFFFFTYIRISSFCKKMNMCINECFLDQNLTVYISPTLISSHQGVDQWENPGKFEAKVLRECCRMLESPVYRKEQACTFPDSRQDSRQEIMTQYPCHRKR